MNGIISSAWIITEWLGVGLELAILATVSAGILALGIWLIEILFRRWMSPSQLAILWVLVLIRLVMPFAPESGFSLWNLTKLSIFQNQLVDPVPNQILPPTVDSNPSLTQSKPSESVALPVNPHLGDSAPPVASDNPGFLLAILPWIWIGVGLGLLASTLLAHLFFCRRLKSETVVADGRLLELWERCCHKVGFNRQLPMVLVEHLDQPAVLGVFHPMLLWPRSIAELSDSQIQLVMMHELGHVKRWDILTNWAMLFLRSVYWWNPIYWIASNRFQNLREQACDAFAIRAMKETKAKEYGELLLLLSHGGHAKGWKATLPVFILGFFASYFRKKAVSNRLRSLSRVSHRPRFFQKTFGALLVIGIGWVGLTDAKTLPQEEDPFLLGLHFPSSGMEVKLGPIVSEPTESELVETREYSITKLLANLNRSDDVDVDGEVEIEGMARGFLGAKNERNRVQVQGNRLVLTTSPRLHEEWSRVQKAWEKYGLSQVVIEVRMIVSQKDLVKNAGISWQSVVVGGVGKPGSSQLGDKTVGEVIGQSSLVETFPMGLTTLSDEVVGDLLRVAQNDRRVNVIQAPKVTQFQGMSTTLSICDQHYFCVGYEDKGNDQLVPIVKGVDVGVRMSLLAAAHEKGKPLHFDARFFLNETEEITNLAKAQVGSITAFIQLPRFKYRTVEISRDLQSGQTLLVGCYPTPSTKKYQYFLFTVRNLEELLEGKP